MAKWENDDFLTAFAVGAALGVAAALLLRPQPSLRKQIRKELRPLGKRARRAGGAIREGSEDALSSGRERAGDMAGDVAELVSDAREELVRVVEDRVSEIEKALKRLRKR